MPDVAVTRAWDETVAGWADPKRHDAFLGVVVTHSAFAYAASCYKERAGDPIADKNLARLQKSAMATMLATAAKRPDEAKLPYRNALLILIALVILMGVGVIYAKFRDHTAVTRTQP